MLQPKKKLMQRTSSEKQNPLPKRMTIQGSGEPKGMTAQERAQQKMEKMMEEEKKKILENRNSSKDDFKKRIGDVATQGYIGGMALGKAAEKMNKEKMKEKMMEMKGKGGYKK